VKQAVVKTTTPYSYPESKGRLFKANWDTVRQFTVSARTLKTPGFLIQFSLPWEYCRLVITLPAKWQQCGEHVAAGRLVLVGTVLATLLPLRRQTGDESRNIVVQIYSTNVYELSQKGTKM
jgi:hypothetical protein